MVKQIATREEWTSLLAEAGDKPVIVDFTASWCGPCKAIGPYFAELAETVGDKAIMVKIDVDEMEELSAEVGITAMPTFMVFKNGVKVETIVGASKDKLKSLVEAACA